MSHDPQLRVLLLAASPSDEEAIRVATEQQVIQDAIREEGTKDRFSLHHITEVYLDHLAETIESEKPHIVHFSGHGTEDDFLLFVRKGVETSHPVSLETLQLMFQTLVEQLQVPIQLVVLNACFSIDIARALSKWVPFTIGMKGKMPALASIEFGVGLYRGIAMGKSIRQAVELGKLKIAEQSNLVAYKDQPELCVQPGADPKVKLLDWVTKAEPLEESSAEPAGVSLRALVAQIREMGRATTQLTGGIEKVLEDGSTDSKLTLSTEDRKAMRQLLSAMDILSASQRSIPGTIRGYANDRTEESWQTVKWLIKDIKDSLQRVLVQFHASAWMFTIEEPEIVHRLTATLQRRFVVLDTLLTMPAPKRPADLKALDEIADSYQELIEQLRCHRKALTDLLLRSSQ